MRRPHICQSQQMYAKHWYVSKLYCLRLISVLENECHEFISVPRVWMSRTRSELPCTKKSHNLVISYFSVPDYCFIWFQLMTIGTYVPKRQRKLGKRYQFSPVVKQFSTRKQTRVVKLCALGTKCTSSRRRGSKGNDCYNSPIQRSCWKHWLRPRER